MEQFENLKLHKTENGHYILIDDSKSTYNKGFIIGSSDDKVYKSDNKSTQFIDIVYKLSKQNCDEIFGVIDVEKLAWQYGITFGHHPDMFLMGFNKAMELNKDKLFTLEQMNQAIRLACNEYSGNIIDYVMGKSVTISEDICGDKVYAVPEVIFDEEGCVILKPLI